MQKNGIKVVSISAEEHLLVHILSHPSLFGDVITKPDLMEGARLVALDHLFCTIGNGLQWRNGVLSDEEDWLDSFSAEILIANRTGNLEEIKRILLGNEITYHRNALEEDSSQDDLMQEYRTKYHKRKIELALQALQDPSVLYFETLVNIDEYPFYNLDEEYSLGLNIPEDIRQDYLDLCFEVLEKILKWDGKGNEEQQENVEIAKRYLERLNERYPNRQTEHKFQEIEGLPITSETYPPLKLSIQEYLERYPEETGLLPSGAKQEGVVESGMIHWPLEAGAWGGPFEGNFVAYILEDLSGHTNLKSKDELLKSHLHLHVHCTYNYSDEILSRVFPGEKWEVVIQGKTYTRYDMTDEELLRLQRSMTKKERKSFEEGLEKESNRFLKETLKGEPSKENPFKLFLYGTDDTSWTAVLGTLEEALDLLNKIVETPSWALIHQRLTFTN